MATRKRSAQQALEHLLVGPDAYLRDERREAIIRENVPEEARDFAVARFSLERTRLSEILAQAVTRPMLGDRQVLVVGDADRMKDDDLEVLEKYLEAPAEFTVLVFEAQSLDKRTRAAKFLTARCEPHELESGSDTRAVERALEFARELEVELDAATAEGLVLLLGSELGLLKSELTKLRAYLGAGGRVTLEDIAAVVVPARKFGVFDLVEPLAEHRREEALLLLRNLLEKGESPMGLVGMLTWLYRQLLVARSLGPQARGALRAPRERAELLLRQASRFAPEELHAAFAALHEADVALKSMPSDNRAGVADKHATLILEVLVAKLAGDRTAAVRR